MNACEKTCVYVWRGNRNLQKVQPSAGFGFSGWLKATRRLTDDGCGTGSGRARAGTIGTDAHTFARFKFRDRRSIWQGTTGAGRARDGLGTGSGRARRNHWHGRAHFRKVQISRQAQHFGKGVQISWQVHHFRKVKCRFRNRRGIFLLLARTHRKSHWQGRARRRMQISWQGPHFREVRNIFRGRRSTFARSSTDFMAGAALSQGQAQISWKAQHFHKVMYIFLAGAALSQGQAKISWHVQHFRKVKHRFRGRHSTFTRSCTYFVAGAALSQGRVQNSWQAENFRNVKQRFRGTRSTFARSTFAAGARKSQLLSTKVVREVNFRSWGSKIATFKYESSTRSALSQLGLENRNF